MRHQEQEDQHRRRGFVPELIFAWKVRRRRHFGRMVLAVVVAGLALASLGVVVRVQGRPVQDPPLRESAASLIILRADDEASRDLIERAREQSPDAVRWMPGRAGNMDASMLEIRNELWSAAKYEPRLQPVPSREVARPPDPVTGLVAPRLPPVEVELPAWQPAPGPGAGPRPVFSASGDLAPRWQDLVSEWPADALQPFVGREAVFVLGVNPAGDVEFCLPRQGIEPALDSMLRRQLAAHTLLESEGADLDWGQVTVRIEAVAEEETGP